VGEPAAAPGPRGSPAPQDRPPPPPLSAGRSQGDWDLRFEWGADGLSAVAAGAAAVVVVDVLRFTSAVSVAVARGASVLPYAWALGDAPRAYAARHKAELGGARRPGGWSLSPTDLVGVAAGARLVLPSPNGSALAFGARDDAPGALVLAGCLRNASAVAAVAGAVPGPVAVVAAGERWGGTLGALRPSVEDLLGAGAVLRGLLDVAERPAGSASPEALAAVAAFDAARDDLTTWLTGSSSGRELAEAGCADDVQAAAALDADAVAPVLDGPEFTGVTPSGAGHLR
jgi:2-phosphosulfolactate phosphatase